jgi:serine/threonine protein kinase/Flp pilus assembly protein TadD
MDDNGPGSKQPLNPTNEDSANTESLAEGTEKLPTCSTADRPTRAEPRLIGDFRIVRLIGAGGMGVVYEAEQQHPKRPVALKVIRGDRYLDDTAIKLFQREAQVLARLKHPAIAAIYESGRTEDGEHFFAMELVRGQTLADWLDKRPASQGLSSDELELRLRIFRRICEGVAYAHQRGVVHRDLKPTNILIFDDEGSGSASDTTGAPGVKILDFGLARITDTDVAATTLVTDAGTIRGTLSYMSPEQIRGNPDEIDMRTDIYSLGVVFYQLLTGDLPYEVLGKPMHEISRAICEEPPKSLVSAWKGSSRPDRDIETITFKALEKSASRRYQSVTALEEDIDRFLRNQPILARPASAVYQLRKMVQRHKVPFYSAAAILLLLTGSVIALSVQASTIAHERDRANQEARNALAVTEFLVQLFAVADPTEARDKDITARELLDRGVDQMSGDLEQQPEVRAALSGVLGRVYLNLGVFDQAAPLLEEASVLQGELYGQQSAEAAQVAGNLAVLYMMTGEFAKAESRMNESLALRRILYGDRSSEVAEGLYYAASLHLHKGEFQAAIPLLEEALSTEQELSSGQNEATANIISDLAYSAIKLGRDDEAERLNREALAQRREILGDDHPSVAQSLNNLGQSLRNRGNFDEAEQMIREAVALNRRIYGEHHPELNATLSSLASVLRDSNKLEEAEQVLREIVAGNRKTYGDAHPDVAGNLVMLGSVLERQGEPVAAESQYREALDIQRKVFTGDSWQIATTKNLLASSLISQGRHREAEPLLVESFRIISNTFGDDHPRTAAARRRVIANYEAWGKDGLADPYRPTEEE